MNDKIINRSLYEPRITIILDQEQYTSKSIRLFNEEANFLETLISMTLKTNLRKELRDENLDLMTASQILINKLGSSLAIEAFFNHLCMNKTTSESGCFSMIIKLDNKLFCYRDDLLVNYPLFLKKSLNVQEITQSSNPQLFNLLNAKKSGNFDINIIDWKTTLKSHIQINENKISFIALPLLSDIERSNLCTFYVSLLNKFSTTVKPENNNLNVLNYLYDILQILKD